MFLSFSLTMSLYFLEAFFCFSNLYVFTLVDFIKFLKTCLFSLFVRISPSGVFNDFIPRQE